MHRRTLFTLTGSALSIAFLNACAGGSNAPITGFNLAVAASLKDVMQALDAAFTQQSLRPAATLQAAGSGVLAQQIVDGARFDVFASADRTSMAKVVDAKIISDADVISIATANLLVVANPKSAVTELTALATSGTKVVLADSTVPAGRYAQIALANLTALYGAEYANQVNANVVSLETNVRAVLQKVQSGEADAGVVYTADITKLSDKDIRTITIPAEYGVQAEYVAAVLPSAQAGSHEFLAFIRGDDAQAIWQSFGFRA